MKPTIPALLLIGMMACANAPAGEAKLDAREAKELAKALDGKTAGKPVSCVSNLSSSNLRAVGDHTLVYRVNRKLTYRNDLQGVCHGLSFGDTLVLRVYGSQYCRGDIAHVVDLQSGMQGGSCALGEFVPYTSADAG